MMGELPQQQNALFYDFCLEKHIPEHYWPGKYWRREIPLNRVAGYSNYALITREQKRE